MNVLLERTTCDTFLSQKWHRRDFFTISLPFESKLCVTFGHFVTLLCHSVTLFFEKCHRVFRCNCKEKSESCDTFPLFL
nr:MAG TPA: hypothetical protein [Caudoviricetes sp.]